MSSGRTWQERTLGACELAARCFKIRDAPTTCREEPRESSTSTGQCDICVCVMCDTVFAVCLFLFFFRVTVVTSAPWDSASDHGTFGIAARRDRTLLEELQELRSLAARKLESDCFLPAPPPPYLSKGEVASSSLSSYYLGRRITRAIHLVPKILGKVN